MLSIKESFLKQSIKQKYFKLRKKANKYKFNFFLSYAHENKDEVMKMLNYLTLANLTAWTDKDEMKQGSIDVSFFLSLVLLNLCIKQRTKLFLY